MANVIKRNSSNQARVDMNILSVACCRLLPKAQQTHSGQRPNGTGTGSQPLSECSDVGVNPDRVTVRGSLHLFRNVHEFKDVSVLCTVYSVGSGRVKKKDTDISGI